MESSMFASRRPLPAALAARTVFPRVAPSTIASIAMEDLRLKNMAFPGETSASKIIAQWAAWRREACKQMLLDHDSIDLAILQAVSTMLDASFLRNDGGCVLVRRSAREGTAPAPQQSAGGGRQDDGDGDGGDDAHVKQRDPPMLHRRRARENVVMRELQCLSQHRAVSTFAHRSRLESILQRRLFCGGRPMHDDGSLSVATMELGQLSHSDPATGLSSADSELHIFTDRVLLDGNHHFENSTGNHEIHTVQSMEDPSVNAESTVVPNSNDDLQDDIDQEHMHGHDQYSDSGSSEQGSEQYGPSSYTQSDYSVPQLNVTFRQPNEGERDGDDEQHFIESQEAAEPQWFSHALDDIHGVEIPELRRRRSVSTLLSSGFGESLDQQLMQSYARRQELIESYSQILNEDHAATDHGANEPNQAGHDDAARPWIEFSGEGQRRRQWYWTRPEFVLDAIHELEVDMVGLYRGMTGMHQMLEECMEMQIELQRSIRQEVSAALNRSVSTQGWAEGQLLDDASRWQLVRKGTCCVCCENQIDSLLYRCGHMCTCSKCASELLNRTGTGTCPMCRAPIVEVVRAYTT